MKRRDFIQKFTTFAALLGLGKSLKAQEQPAAKTAAAPAATLGLTKTDTKITFLGTSHGLVTYTRFHSSTMLQVNGKVYIIDAGDGVCGLISRQHVPLTDLNAIFITHQHEDHYGGLFNLLEQHQFFQQVRRVKCPEGKLKVLLPGDETVTMMQNVRKDYYGSPKYNPTKELIAYKGNGKIYEDDTVRVTAFGNDHMGKRPDGTFRASSFLFELANGKRIVFSGDLHKTFDLPLQMFGEKPCDLFVCELVHYPIANAVERLKGLKINKICFQHYGDNWEAPGWEKRFEAFAKQLPAPAEIVTDGTIRYV